MSTSPILLIAYNRPDLTRRVFASIREARPRRLFVAADGPRPDDPQDFEKCRLARNVIQVDWDCELHTLYSEAHLGCGVGPSRAISWYFENVEQGIILEDDCVPSQSFFPFCDELLDYYRGNDSIFAISGTNVLGQIKSRYSFVFSYLGGIWGWATWRRAWKLYDYEMRHWNEPETRQRILRLLGDKAQFAAISQTFDNRPTTWDYQWLFTRLAYGGLSVVPAKNLVSNVGFGEEATHTLDANSNLSCLPAFDLDFPLRFDPHVRVNRGFDYLKSKKYGYYKAGDTSIFKRVPRVFSRTFLASSYLNLKTRLRANRVITAGNSGEQNAPKQTNPELTETERAGGGPEKARSSEAAE